jgi:hypothetical protein
MNSPGLTIRDYFQMQLDKGDSSKFDSYHLANTVLLC